MKIEEITPALVNSAIDIYLARAYEIEALREAHQVHFAPTKTIHEILEEFEREDTKLASYSLRLGSQHYPHMKLALMEAYFKGEYVFAVDRHDGFDFGKTGEDYEKWLGIKSKNHQQKLDIEEGWYQVGVPTLRRLKESRLSKSDVLREFSGQRILLVDNDGDAGAIMQMILVNAGYGCLWAHGTKEALSILDDPERRSNCGLALVDLMLSDGSGLDVVKAIRANSDTQEMPIILTSAMNGSDVILTDVDIYLRKPYSTQDLLNTVAATLRQRYDGHEQLVEELRHRKKQKQD